jgi:hypothetical protein
MIDSGSNGRKGHEQQGHNQFISNAKNQQNKNLTYHQLHPTNSKP